MPPYIITNKELKFLVKQLGIVIDKEYGNL